jgi:hypothetical protein
MHEELNIKANTPLMIFVAIEAALLGSSLAFCV